MAVSCGAAATVVAAALVGCGGSEAPPPAGEARQKLSAVQTVQAAQAGPGERTETFYSEGGKLMRADENVAALGNDLMGDRVNLYNGTLEFVHTDANLPGNSALPVAAGRRLVTGQPQRVAGHFGDWDLEVPRLHGVFSQSKGWSVGAGEASASTARCTGFGPPPQVRGQSLQGTFNPEEYWHGSFLYLPGAGSQELLLPDTTPASVQPTGTALAAPKLTTKDRWLIYCGTPLKAGAGEGFTAVAPDGTRYRFDWMVARPYPQIEKAYGTPPQRPTGEDPSAYNATVLLKRQEVWILPTEVLDRFGNLVSYEWDAAIPWRLKKILSVDRTSGARRELSFEYDADAAEPAHHRVSRISDGSREWRYGYADHAPYGKSLISVTVPGGGAWAMDMSQLG
ncbi:MAG: hypothetical protein JNM33_01175, partial [Rubrivivax sp.]|nr:hypothetical protein [Rubrivivax sp.]